MEYQEEWIFKVIWINLHIPVLTMISLPMLRSDTTVSPVEAGAARLCRGSFYTVEPRYNEGPTAQGTGEICSL